MDVDKYGNTSAPQALFQPVRQQGKMAINMMISSV